MAKMTNRLFKGRKQIIYSEPRKIFKEEYLTAKGERLLKSKKITKEEAWKKYGKKRYTINKNAFVVKEIFHKA